MEFAFKCRKFVIVIILRGKPLNFFSYELTDDRKNVLFKGLNFSGKSGLVEYSAFLLLLSYYSAAYNLRIYVMRICL